MTNIKKCWSPEFPEIRNVGVVRFGSDRIRTYRGKDEKANPVDSYRLSTPERVPGRTKSRTEEGQDGRSRAGGSERSEEPQRDTREKKVILVLRLSNTSTRNIYTRERMRRSGRRVRELSNLSENNKIGSRGNCGVRESEIMKHSAREGNIGNSER